MDNRGVHEGMVVRSSDGEKLGKVVQCADDFFLIEKGFFFPKDYLARYEQVSGITDDEIHLSATAASLGEPGGTSTERSTETDLRSSDRMAGGGLGAGAMATGEHQLGTREDTLGTREDTRIPLAEEEVTAEKRMKDAGEVRVRKETITEHRQIQVPVTREEVHVERVAVSPEQQAGPDAFREGTISVPLREEEVEIRKRPVVREEVRISKTRRQEEVRADAEVRHEEARIEGADDLQDTTRRTDRGDVTRRDPDDGL